jgi:hypothetical protein
MQHHLVKCYLIKSVIALTINVTFKKENYANTSLLFIHCLQIWSMFTFLASAHLYKGKESSVEVGVSLC